jgi:DNA polymerase I
LIYPGDCEAAAVRTIRHWVAGEECLIQVPEDNRDLDLFFAFLAEGHQFLAFDTESTGLDLFSKDHKLRLLQIGHEQEAWVLKAEQFRNVCQEVMHQPRNWIAHNAPFDALTIERHLGVPLEVLMPRIWDTKIMAHLTDPRERKEGGIGLRLKDQSAAYVDPKAPDTQDGLTAVFNSFGWTKKTGWARISIDHMTYLLYAGLDAILAARLFKHLFPVVQNMSELSKFEHRLQYLLTLLQRKGMRLDIPYIERLIIDLHNEYVDQVDIALDLGVENVNSVPQVITRLVEMGEELTERTLKTQALKGDKAVLTQLADLDRQWHRNGVREPNPLADAVLRARRASKWSTAYAEACLTNRDQHDRLHPNINSLQARTARMSISNPALQQLPASDWRIRRCFIADPGNMIIAVDYQAVEMRVLAALSGDWTMRDAIKKGLDLHAFTAERVFGPDFTSHHRKVAKSIGFGKVYGGGAETISRQTGADMDAVKVALSAYDKTFPGIRRYSQQLIRVAKQGLLEVVTPIGRRLPLDPERLYACTNYMVQSTARDLLAKAIVRVFEAGLGDFLLLPVHDELLGQAPAADAEAVVKEIGTVMASTFQGVEITTSPKVLGLSWGAGYGAPEAMPEDMPVRRERRPREGQWVQGGLDLGI